MQVASIQLQWTMRPMEAPIMASSRSTAGSGAELSILGVPACARYIVLVGSPCMGFLILSVPLCLSVGLLQFLRFIEGQDKK